MGPLWRRWPLMAMAVALLAGYAAMAEAGSAEEGPRTFIAGLAAVTLGAWLYSVGHDDNDGGTDD